jgi:hypothetical protein
MSLLTSLLDRRSKLTCAACGGQFLSGVVRFENGQKAGSLCHACAEGREPEISPHRLVAQNTSSQSR